MPKRLPPRLLQILGVLARDGRASLTEVARELGVSHTAVRRHLSKAVGEGLVRIAPLLSVSSLGLRMAILFLEVDTIDRVEELAERFRECPRLVYMFRVTGRYNLVAIVVAESPEALDSIMGTCMLRTCPGIRRSEVIVVTDYVYPCYLPMRVAHPKRERAPCGADCSSCRRLHENKCPACSATKYYRGWLAARDS